MTFEELESMTFEELENYSFEELLLLTAIYDRTQTDITNKTAKGYMNLSDLNRVESNIKTVADELAVPYVQKTWAIGETPQQADYLKIKTAVDAIKTAFDVLQISPSRPFNTFTKWNELEYLLYYTDLIFNQNKEAQSYCGEYYCGEYGILG